MRTGPETRGRWIDAALVVTIVLFLPAALSKLVVRTTGDGLAPFLGFFVATAFLLVALLVRRATSLAWISTVIAGGLLAVEIVGGLRRSGSLTDTGGDAIGLGGAITALVAAAGLAAAFAASPRARSASPWDRLGVAIACAAVVAVAAAGAWAVVQGLSGAAPQLLFDLAPTRIVGRLALLAVVIGLAAGAARDGVPLLRRARTTWSADSPEEARRSFASHLADAAVPARATQGRAAREDERARLAADLHATVLPQLRRAAAAATTDTVSEDVRAGVRRALEDVEHLMHGRQSIVLEQFGLVAALEWLAERTEQAGEGRVDLELEGDQVERRGAVPPDIERAAFRIALLALDNVVRHAKAGIATIGLRLDERSIELTIRDDGTAEDLAAPVRTPTGRGLADMQREAAASGGTLRTTPPPAMTVTAIWLLRPAA